jgi:hypothetical protein
LPEVPITKSEFSNVIYIPGEEKGENRRNYLDPYYHEWIQIVLILRIKEAFPDIISDRCSYISYTIIDGGTSLQEPHFDGQDKTKKEVSILISLGTDTIVAAYDCVSYDINKKSIEYSLIGIPQYQMLMFDSNTFLHGGGKDGGPRIFIHCQYSESNNNFKPVFPDLEYKILKASLV